MKPFLSMSHAAALFLLTLLFACQTIQGPQTLEDRIQYGKASLTVAYKSIDSLAVRKRITKDDGMALIAQADEAKAAIAAAETALGAGMGEDAAAKLNVALTALTALEAYLKTKEGAP